MNGYGVNFQPGSVDQMPTRRPEGSSQQGVQEAIKVLSLRLPKVVGAQASAPTALLSSQGGGGRPNVDSIVEQVLAKYFPTGDSQPAQAPMVPSGEPSQPDAPSSMPNFGGMGRPESPRQQGPVPENFWTNFPRVVVGPVTPPGDFSVDETGRPIGGPSVPGGPGGIGGVFETLPDLRQNLDWLKSPQLPMTYQPPEI